eukprot:6885009-Alexandrium_andersonii.AAC.1
MGAAADSPSEAGGSAPWVTNAPAQTAATACRAKERQGEGHCKGECGGTRRPKRAKVPPP